MVSMLRKDFSFMRTKTLEYWQIVILIIVEHDGNLVSAIIEYDENVIFDSSVSVRVNSLRGSSVGLLLQMHWNWHDQEKALLILLVISLLHRDFLYFAIGLGKSTFDKASVHYYVQSHIQINEYRDRVVLPNVKKKFGRHIGACVKVLYMTGLKLSALSQIKLLTVISTIDDLNYPEKTDTYYVVNRTRKKIQVLQGCGRDELLKIIDLESIPHFCRKEGSGSSRHSSNGNDDCFSLYHSFHQVF
ncbi:hypothetical protein MKX01_000469 [Papaver californicum]|nr:hypothetical protein MKX01_000469 [Papaver californicum]